MRALPVWLASRIGLALFVLLAAVQLDLGTRQPGRTPGIGLLDRFVWWDSFHFLRIADLGYLPPGLPCCDQAFFPGYPLLIRGLSPVTAGNLPLAGLLASALAGAAAAVLLWQLARRETGDPALADRATSYLAVAPFGIFLSAVYSEALFLALSLAAWLAARCGRWWTAGLLAGVTAVVRINGLFLALGLVTMYLLQRRAEGGVSAEASAGSGPGRRWLLPRRDAVALLFPFAAVAGYFGWLYRATGSWTAWLDAEHTGWERGTAWPWQGLQAGWELLWSSGSADQLLSRGADLVTAVAGLVLVGVLVARRCWPEAVYLAPNVLVLVCSTTLVSGPRYALLWFPGYLLVARWTGHPRWGRAAHQVVLAGCAGLLGVLSLAFAAHQWVA